MAANTYRTAMFEHRFGQDGARVELWTIDFNSASAAVIKTSLNSLMGVSGIKIGGGGAANMPSVVGTVNGLGRLTLSSGTVLVEYTSTSVDVFQLQLIGR